MRLETKTEGTQRPTGTTDATVEVAPATRGRDDIPVPRTRRFYGAMTLTGLAVLAWGAFVYAPTDEFQGTPQRIFYIHVPSAWVGFLAFTVVFVASIAFLATGRSKWDQIAASSAEVGVVFTSAVLITGPLWGRPTWGKYWEWDPRLTSFLMLWLIYCSYLALRSYVPDPSKRARYSAVLGIVGFFDIPIVFLAVRWWRSQHPGELVLKGALPGSMLLVMFIGLAAFTFMYLYLMSIRLRVQKLRDAREEVEL
jgi:heme exporter protein C